MTYIIVSQSFSMSIKTLAAKAMTNGFINTIKEEAKNREGKVNMARLGVEAIGVLVLVVIWTLIPQIGAAITTGMPDLPAGSAWAAAGNGTSLWIQAEPMLRICVIVLIAALILAVIFELRAGKRS